MIVPSSRPTGLLTAHPTRMVLAQAVAAGLDFVLVDAELTAVDVARCEAVVAQLSGHGVDVLIRVPDLEPSTLVAFANTGADELVLPQVRDHAQVEQAHEATRYTPAGTRSRQVSVASRYGTDFSHQVRLSVLLETVEAVEDVATFAASPLLDGAWVGPTDLAGDLARHRPDEAVDLDATIDAVIAAHRAAGRGVGLPAKDPAGVAAAFARGADRCAVYWEAHVGAALRAIADAGR